MRLTTKGQLGCRGRWVAALRMRGARRPPCVVPQAGDELERLPRGVGRASALHGSDRFVVETEARSVGLMINLSPGRQRTSYRPALTERATEVCAQALECVRLGLPLNCTRDPQVTHGHWRGGASPILALGMVADVAAKRFRDWPLWDACFVWTPCSQSRRVCWGTSPTSGSAAQELLHLAIGLAKVTRAYVAESGKHAGLFVWRTALWWDWHARTRGHLAFEPAC